ncbi:WG repeat-containing protein [Achromobacter marplatensis]|uniref:WG repeat-containing protein n=1 Tax=Achromobacter marplatensis TaxID=470868 RepID=UPI0039F6AA01
MGNRAWLVLQSEQYGQPVSAEIASANGNLPTLWQVLLADGDCVEADTSQRVFGDAETAGLAATAHAAHDRLCEVAAFLLSHAVSNDAAYCLQLDAAATYLAERIDQEPEGAGLWISANLDELAWMHEGGAAAYVGHVRALCNERWQAMREGMAAHDVPTVLRLLEVRDLGDDAGWAWRFGLGGLDHPYFAQQEPPRAVRYDDFEADAGEEGEDEEEDGDDRDGTHLGGGLHRFLVDKLWGVRVGPDAGGKVLLAPRFDAIWAFEDGAATVLKHDKLGLIDTEGRELMPCELDEVWSYSQGLAMARVGGQIGFVDNLGAWAISPRFESAGDFSPGGLAPAYEAGQWGLIDRHGAWTVPPQWDDINWDDALHAYVTQRGDLHGLIDLHGHQVLDALYAAMGPADPVADLVVDDAADDAANAAALWANNRMRVRVLTDDGKRGIVDGRGQAIVPVAYTDLGNVIWLPSDDPAEIPPPPRGQEGRYVRVLQCVDHGEWDEWSQGVYDMLERREVLPCAQQMVFGLKWAARYGWLCAVSPDAAGHSEDGLHVGIADAQGAWLHEPVYAWIGAPASLRTGDGVHGGPLAISTRWAQGLPVQARRADTGEVAWLHSDGRVDAQPRVEPAG